MVKRRERLWIGMVEVRSLKGKSTVLGNVKGAFVHIVTWAADAQQYREKVELVIKNLGGLFVAEVVEPEPVDARRGKLRGEFEAEIEDVIERAKANPNAIIYGTFHRFEKDDA